jgi:hypothetical protein
VARERLVDSAPTKRARLWLAASSPSVGLSLGDHRCLTPCSAQNHAKDDFSVDCGSPRRRASAHANSAIAGRGGLIVAARGRVPDGVDGDEVGWGRCVAEQPLRREIADRGDESRHVLELVAGYEARHETFEAVLDRRRERLHARASAVLSEVPLNVTLSHDDATAAMLDRFRMLLWRMRTASCRSSHH